MYSAKADTGPIVYSLLKSPASAVTDGKKIIGVNEWLNLHESAKLLAQVLGKKIEFVGENPSFDLGDPELEKDQANMIGFCIEFGYDGGKADRSVLQWDLQISTAVSNDAGPGKLRSVKEWFEGQDWEGVV